MAQSKNNNNTHTQMRPSLKPMFFVDLSLRKKAVIVSNQGSCNRSTNKSVSPFNNSTTTHLRMLSWKSKSTRSSRLSPEKSSWTTSTVTTGDLEREDVEREELVVASKKCGLLTCTFCGSQVKSSQVVRIKIKSEKHGTAEIDNCIGQYNKNRRVCESEDMPNLSVCVQIPPLRVRSTCSSKRPLGRGAQTRKRPRTRDQRY